MAVRNPFGRSRGFTIAEVLAALLVMAVGIIGIAALYSDQVQTNPEAQLHREAAELADRIADRMRETKEGHAGFATTIGVLCDQQSKLVLPQDIAVSWSAPDAGTASYVIRVMVPGEKNGGN